MNFITFPVNTTNIFPMANTVKGGQLVTEFNLRSRESVATPESVNYMIGPSYVHSESDYMVRLLNDGAGTTTSTTVLEILPGKAVINGHFVECLSSMIIDMTEANAKAQELGIAPLKGKLCIGLRAMYSTLPTMAGSILAEDSEEMYEGIQVVILPENEFKLPIDVPNDENAVTAHIKLASFNYINGSINESSIVNNYPDKCKNIDANRISNIDGLLSSVYIKKTGLKPKSLYTFSGKGTDPDTGMDTWCDSTDSLMVWDKNPQLTNEVPMVDEAQFALLNGTKTVLILPHKQVDGMTDTAGNAQYYAEKMYNLPLADYTAGTAGTIDKSYTNHIKEVINQINDIYIRKGKQRGYITELSTRDIFTGTGENTNNLPPINSAWSVGDYILVNLDYTLDETADGVRAPSTMYVVLPGLVKSIKYVSSQPSGALLGYSEGEEEPIINIAVSDGTYYSLLKSEPGDFDTNYGNYYRLNNLEDGTRTLTKLTSAEEFAENTYYQVTDSTDVICADDEDQLVGYFDISVVRGIVNEDYFEYKRVYVDENNQTKEKSYYFVVSSTYPKEYSDPVYVTGEIPLAQEDVIGGFRNVPDTATDYGYVIRDDQGYLRLLDYDLLRTGVLAYQLGEDFTVPSGLTTEEVQSYLDEYVNQRVAFPNANQLSNAQENGDNAYVINITIELSAEEEAVELNLYGIDSRFNTSIFVHINGTADSNTTINISNCQKIRIDSNINSSSGTIPVINLYNCNLYYDSNILEDLNIIQDLNLWYQRFEEDDPNLLVDGMTVREIDAPIIADDLDFWNQSTPNDNHFMYALQSITFGPDGTIIGCGLFVKNDTSANVTEGNFIIVSSFEVPQGSGLTYPVNRLTKQLKVTGSFVTAYPTSEPQGYMTINTNFTALSGTYSQYDTSNSLTGTISFYMQAVQVGNATGITAGTSIDGWEPGSFHIFQGGALT